MAHIGDVIPMQEFGEMLMKSIKERIKTLERIEICECGYIVPLFCFIRNRECCQHPAAEMAVLRKSTRTFLFTDLEGLHRRSIKILSLSRSTANQSNLENGLCRKCNSHFKSCVDMLISF